MPSAVDPSFKEITEVHTWPRSSSLLKRRDTEQLLTRGKLARERSSGWRGDTQAFSVELTALQLLFVINSGICEKT